MKIRTFALLAGLAAALICQPAQAADSPAGAPLVKVDWQDPQSLPPRFRNHCSVDTFSGRAYCSDHCGFEYQFYHCSRQSFGCCRIGFGYCDWSGLLRCHP
jgi:hypothetical protein